MRKPLAHRVLVLFFTVAIASLPMLGSAEEYLAPLPIADQWKNVKDIEYRRFVKQKNDIIAGRKPLADREQFEAYYKGALIAKFTDPLAYGKDFPGIRREMQRDLTAAKDPSVRSLLIQLYATELKSIIDANYHPAAQVNALLLIGSLNTKERTPAGAPAIPYNDALAVLRSKFEDNSKPLGIRLAAMMGVLRHVESDWLVSSNRQVDAGTKAALLTIVGTILKQDEATEGVDQRAHDYFRARAMDLFGSLAAFEPSNDSLKLIVATAANSDADMLLRSRAVFALARQQYPQIKDADGEAVVGALTAYLADACKLVIDDVELFRGAAADPARPGGGGGGFGGEEEEGGMEGEGMGGGILGGGMMGGGMMGGGMGGGMMGGAGVAGHEIEVIRRQLLYHVFAARRAMDGTRLAQIPGVKHFKDEVQAYQDLTAALNRLKESADGENVQTDALLRDVKLRRGDLERVRPGATTATPTTDPIFP